MISDSRPKIPASDHIRLESLEIRQNHARQEFPCWAAPNGKSARGNSLYLVSDSHRLAVRATTIPTSTRKVRTHASNSHYHRFTFHCLPRCRPSCRGPCSKDHSGFGGIRSSDRGREKDCYGLRRQYDGGNGACRKATSGLESRRYQKSESERPTQPDVHSDDGEVISLNARWRFSELNQPNRSTSHRNAC